MISSVRLPILCGALLLSACAGEATYAEPPPASPTYVQGATVAGPVDVQGSAEGSAEVVYVDDPPVVEIETYPSVVYEGTTVYFVGGFWYQRGPRGWGYFRNEPPTLAHERVEHQTDARWVHAREAPPPRQARAPEAPREGAPRADVRATQEQGRPEPQAPRPEEARPSDERAQAAKPAEAKKPGEGDETPAPAAPKKRPAAKRAAPPPHAQPERR
jgi:hypothetical protein